MDIAIVDDDPISLAVLSRAVTSAGHSPVSAASAEEAWESLLARHRPIVIVDWVLPGISGIELCQRIRSRKGWPYTYLIMLTSRTGSADRMEAIEAGADDFLVKPLDPAELHCRLKAAQRIIEGEHALEERAADLQAVQEQLEEHAANLEEAVRFREAAMQRFSELFEGLPVACYTFDADGRIYEWNRACEAVFGFRAAEAVGSTVFDLLLPGIQGDPDRVLNSRALRGKASHDLEWEYRRPDGKFRSILTNTIPLKTAEGMPYAAISANLDITERCVLQKRVERELARIGRLNSELKKKQEALQSANQRLNQLATLDGLTGLHNHRHFQEMLDHFYARAEALHEPISVILLDVDHFKQYNDQFGHPAGDQVLRQVGKIVQRRTRDTDLAARYGGEEFVLILPATGKEGALRTAEKIRASLESADWPLRAVTASFGVATLRPGIEGPSALVDLADKALYESKRGGRNRVTHADSVSACQGAAA